MVKPVIFQVSGYQNSGKTTVVSKLIEGLDACGLKTATIKHHGHGGKPDVLSQKDSSKHLTAGALATMVEGDGRLLIQADLDGFGLEDQIEVLKYFHPDVILIEGYKLKSYPKLLLLRDKGDLHLTEQITNMVAAVYWKEDIREYMEKTHCPLPCFSIYDEMVINWTINWIKEQILTQ